MYVADSENRRVQVLSPTTGIYIRQYATGGHGSEPASSSAAASCSSSSSSSSFSSSSSTTTTTSSSSSSSSSSFELVRPTSDGIFCTKQPSTPRHLLQKSQAEFDEHCEIVINSKNEL